ncbi:T7SS effector LXG polymorphic toxin [Bacillus glycinifermentans]|nr:T7SS effector LXG polymorphic toxin [Bacillus glycinifermentans]MEC3609449.1 T7SS effector LXG polymorphic toxin [Bacillus glycinifermentans]UOY89164.1 LXG domain-containing protein [Bacillus glycinifermentans]
MRWIKSPVSSLDDADAIRALYEESHTPFLQFYEAFIDEYQSALKCFVVRSAGFNPYFSSCSRNDRERLI